MQSIIKVSSFSKEWDEKIEFIFIIIFIWFRLFDPIYINLMLDIYKYVM